MPVQSVVALTFTGDGGEACWIASLPYWAYILTVVRNKLVGSVSIDFLDTMFPSVVLGRGDRSRLRWILNSFFDIFQRVQHESLCL